VVELTATLAGTDPGSQFTVGRGTLLLGASLGDPLSDPWPESWTGLNAVDHDGDGKPGVTTLAKSGNGYGLPRLDIFNDQIRADEIYLALRTILSLDGIVDSCGRATGVATFNMEQHAVGCHVNGGGDCSTEQVNLLDNNLPQLQVSGGSFELVSIPDGSSCADVLRTLP
jgi:hypothetical protein